LGEASASSCILSCAKLDPKNFKKSFYRPAFRSFFHIIPFSLFKTAQRLILEIKFEAINAKKALKLLDFSCII